MTLTLASDLLVTKSGISLDIGCGANKQGEDWVGLDIRELPGVDIVQDFQEFPWPLPDECANRAIASHVVEHINPANFGFIKFMDEVWRIMKPGGKLAVITPHAWSSGYVQDPTHVNPCNEATFGYFDPFMPRYGGLWGIYQPKPWRITHINWNYATNIEAILVKRTLDEISGNGSH